MQQPAVPRARPIVLTAPSRAMRWGPLALASIAVPASITLAALLPSPASLSAPVSLPAPAALELAPIAPVREPAPKASSDSAPASPAYRFVWTEECESSCPGRGEF